jgi:bifunctional non-homologous end joining protein LigD
VDGELIVCDDNGLSVFDRLWDRQHDQLATLCAFDVLELSGTDVRFWPIEERKATLKMLLRVSHPGIVFSRYFDLEGSILYHHACRLGYEGIVSKRLGSRYRGGRSGDWVKVVNPTAPAVKREAREEWR